MNSIKFTPTNNFDREIKALYKKYPSLKSDITNLLKELQSNPYLGESLGSNLYKIRIAIKSKNKGKSGGARVIDYVIESENDKIEIFFVSIYDKSEYKSADIAALKEYIKTL